MRGWASRWTGDRVGGRGKWVCRRDARSGRSVGGLGSGGVDVSACIDVASGRQGLRIGGMGGRRNHCLLTAIVDAQKMCASRIREEERDGGSGGADEVRHSVWVRFPSVTQPHVINALQCTFHCNAPTTTKAWPPLSSNRRGCAPEYQVTQHSRSLLIVHHLDQPIVPSLRRPHSPISPE